MTTPKIEHTTFVIERELPGSPAHAFRFWTDPALKARWSGCHADWTVLEDRFDFRAGGLELKRWRTPDGDELTFQAFYLDVVAVDRIIYAYEMAWNGERLSASLVTIELTPIGPRTRMKFTEQAAFLTPGDRQQRILGTEEGLDRLVAIVEAETACAH